VTENANPVTESAEPDLADPRAERILDAAAALLVRWGYRRVTIEDVAREASVGKGTVYLHFRTKEALFVTVLLREQRAVLEGLVERMRADPAQALPSELMASVYLRMAADPVARVVYLGDPETFGRLAQEAAGTLGELTRRRDAVLTEHLAELRATGLLRTDLPAETQRYLLSAMSVGFYLLSPETMSAVPAEPEQRADALRHAVAAALETGDGPPSAAQAERIAARYASLIEHLEHRWRERLRRPPSEQPEPRSAP
jgi:AcrR family transcriptional regulator